ncbi:MAG: hypothetical protein ACOX3N_06015 [Dethiobacteria bacterium]|jgi:multidrug efflux pump subunit AcrB
MQDLKKNLRVTLDNFNGKFQAIESKANELQADSKYSKEYKVKKEKELSRELEAVKQEAVKKISSIFDNEINRLNSINIFDADDDIKTSNILKMLELSKDSLTEKEIQHLAKHNEDSPIVMRTLKAIAESRSLRVDIDFQLPDTERLNQAKNNFLEAISSNNGLKLELAYEYL